MNAQDISDIIDGDVSDTWMEIIADICRGDNSADTPENNALALKREFESMARFIQDKDKRPVYSPAPAPFGSAEWYRQKAECEL